MLIDNGEFADKRFGPSGGARVDWEAEQRERAELEAHARVLA
jgi:hypothetical protein